MTVSSTTVSVSYTGNGSTTEFSFPNLFLADDHLVVTVDDVVQTLNSDYTVAGAKDPNGGAVTFTTAPASGTAIQIRRATELLQPLDLVANDRFPAEPAERAWDRLTLISQEQDDRVDTLETEMDAAESRLDIVEDEADRALKHDGSSGSAAYDAQGRQIKQLAAPTANQDAATRQYVDDRTQSAGGADLALRADLASTDAGKGAELVARLQADSMFALAQLPKPDTDGFGVELRAFYSDTDTGGGRFYWDAGRDKATANGGTIIDPDNVGTLSATALGTFLDMQGTGEGEGCWMRADTSSILTPEMFGALGDNITNDRGPIERTAKVLYEKGGGKIIFDSSKTYYFNNVFPYSNIEWDFNYCNLRLRNDPSFGGQNSLFANPNGGPGIGNPLNPNADARYGSVNPSTAGSYTDQHRPLDTSITYYPVGTKEVTMDGGAQGLEVDDWVFFCSGPHDGIDDWSGYQSFEMEYCKIRAISGNTISFYEPTVMTHRLLQETAFDTGQSQYGAVAWWTLSKIADFSMEENLTFKNLRMVVDQTGWDQRKNLFNLHNVYNLIMENCHIHCPDTLPYFTKLYNRGRRQLYIDCQFTGKWDVATGADVAQVSQRYVRCVFIYTGGEGYLHFGERFADIHFEDCFADMGASPTVGEPGGGNLFFTDENENISVQRCTFLNMRSPFGMNLTAQGHGSLTLRDNIFGGYWLQPPMFFRGQGANIALVEGNKVNCTISERATAGQGMSFNLGTFRNNEFNVLTESSGQINVTSWGAFSNQLANTGSQYDGVFVGNVGIPDVIDQVISGCLLTLDPTQNANYARPVNNRLVISHPSGVNANSYYSIDRQDSPGKLGAIVEVYGFITAPSTEAVRYRLFIGDIDIDSVFTEQNDTVDLTGKPANTEFIVSTIKIGAGSDTGIQVSGLQFSEQRIGTEAADTFTGTFYVSKIKVITYPSMGS